MTWKAIAVRLENLQERNIHDRIRETTEGYIIAGWRPVGAIGSTESDGLYLVFEMSVKDSE